MLSNRLHAVQLVETHEVMRLQRDPAAATAAAVSVDVSTDAAAAAQVEAEPAAAAVTDVMAKTGEIS